MAKYYFTTQSGHCGIEEAPNLKAAQRQMLRELGTSQYKSVEKATPEQIAWVRAMGGWTGHPSGLKRKINGEVVKR